MSSSRKVKSKRRTRAPAKQRSRSHDTEVILAGKPRVQKSTSGQLALTGCVAALSFLALIGIGASASFSGTTSDAQQVSTGSVVLALGDSGTTANRLNVAVTNVAPGDSIQRSVDIINSGTIDWSALTVTTSATTSSLLDTDATNGLQMVIDECTTAWTETINGSAYTYTCASPVVRVASRAVVGSGISIGGAALTHGATGHYRITLTLPTTSGNNMQTLSSSIQYAFTGQQRAAEAK